LTQLLPVIGWHTQHFADDVDREASRDVVNEVAATVGDIRFDKRCRDFVDARFQRCDVSA
jgi:hypothetical protein